MELEPLMPVEPPTPIKTRCVPQEPGAEIPISSRGGKESGRYWKVRENGGEGGSALEPAEKALTVTQLTRTSRQIYLDLAADPAFYRSDVFSFRDPRQLHFFLAALTPGRRRAIRDIRVHEVRNSPSSHDSMATATRTSASSTSATWRPVASRARAANTVTETNAILRAVVPRARSAIRLDSPSLWDLPGFAITLYVGDFNEVVIELGEDAPEEALPRRFRERGDFVTVLREAKTAFRDHQLRLRERRKQNPRTRPTDWEVYNATRGAGLDFPGEIRINQKGTPRGFETTPKHGAEGVLAWRVYGVRDIRRKGPVRKGQGLECLVEFADQGLSWEEELFRGEDDPRQRLEAIERTPKPGEAKDALGDLVDSASPYNSWGHWEEITRRRESAIRRLKRRVEQIKLIAVAEAISAGKQGTTRNASTE
ncbi:hypothetical protein DL770_003019 [Monosporascus sp. CRB-9-2]|nr:hypothetical protein DL770_003019 [Monosporascus sp. CRB-9-2]